MRAVRRTSPAFLLAAAVTLAGVLWPAASGAAATTTTSSDDASPAAVRAASLYPRNLIVKSELRLKANLVRDNLTRPVQLVFFGGSRSQRFDPVYAWRKLGLRAVNLSLSNGHPEALWAYAHWLYKRYPDTNIRWIIGVQPSMMHDRPMDAALLQDARFYKYFSDWLLASQRKHLPKTVAQMPKSYGFLRNRYSKRGLLLRNTYDRRVAAGYTLKQSLAAYIAKMLKPHTRGETYYTTRASRFFEQTLQLLNDHGATPVIVLMPVHPHVLAVMRHHHLTGERTKLREYFTSLESTYTIKVLDFTNISSFNGNRNWFYDGVHITRSNANRVIAALKRKAADALALK